MTRQSTSPVDERYMARKLDFQAIQIENERQAQLEKEEIMKQVQQEMTIGISQYVDLEISPV